MKTYLHPLSIALVSMALLGSCSRPVAHFQPSNGGPFYTRHNAAAPVTSPETTSAVPTVANVPEQTARTAPPLTEGADALVSLKAVHAADGRMTRRMANARYLLAGAGQQVTAREANVPANSVLSTKKASLLERMALKRLDKAIKKHVGAKEGISFTGYVRLGLIIAAIGLILLLIGNSLGTLLGLIALIGGLALVVVGLLEQ